MGGLFKSKPPSAVSGITDENRALYEQLVQGAMAGLAPGSTPGVLAGAEAATQAGSQRLMEALRKREARTTAEGLANLTHEQRAAGVGRSGGADRRIAEYLARRGESLDLALGQTQMAGYDLGLRAQKQPWEIALGTMQTGRPIGMSAGKPSPFSQILSAGTGAAGAYFGAKP